MALFDFHLMKFNGAIVFQVLEQKIYTPAFSDYISDSGWRVSCDDKVFPTIFLGNKTIHLRTSESESYEDLYHVSVTRIPVGFSIDNTYNDIIQALEGWAILARNIDEV